MDTLSVGVVGLGFDRTWTNGFHHHPRCRLGCVCDLDGATLERAAAESSPGAITSRFEDVIEDPRIDAVAIFTPAPIHAEQAVAVLRAGKHVLSAVPAAVTVEGCQDISLRHGSQAVFT